VQRRRDPVALLTERVLQQGASSGACSAASTRLSATRLGTRICRRLATSVSRRSRTFCTPAASPPGRNSRITSRPNPVNTSWYCGFQKLSTSMSATPIRTPLMEPSPPMTAIENTTRP